MKMEKKNFLLMRKINDGNNIILGFMGGYRNCLELISCTYINFDDYYRNVYGYIELKQKLKNEEFRKKIFDELENHNESDIMLFKTCCLSDELFIEIIKYCID